MNNLVCLSVTAHWQVMLVVCIFPWISAFMGGGTLAAQATTHDDIGYTRLTSMLGSDTPNGVGVAISQVEAANSGAYFPDETNHEFTAPTDPLAMAIDLLDGSGGESEGTTGHATFNVGKFFYGNTVSVTGAANQVTIYEANDWLNNVLNLSSNRDPQPQDFRVQNFSWIGNLANSTQDRKALRRFDYVIDNNDVTAVVGLSNSKDPLPSLMGQSYNALAVGRTDGIHSTGVTESFYGANRIKPDLVAPRAATSEATAITSSAAALLHEALVGTDGVRSEVMRALLLAGATKEEIVGWNREVDQPLDLHYGAGELNIYNSYLMTAGGQFEGSTEEPAISVGTHGWDYQTLIPDNDRYYNFEVPAGSTATQLSIILSWNAQVIDTDSGINFSGSKSLADLNLALYDSTEQFMGSMLDESVSSVDNVEHIFQEDLGPGVYTLQVSAESARDFGLAWRLNNLYDTPSADFNGDGVVGGIDFLTWQQNFGTLIGATHAMGDSDGDGDVDEDDLVYFQSDFGSSPGFLSFVSVPEPEAITLVLLAILCHWICKRRLLELTTDI